MADNAERLLENRWAAPAWMRPMLREAAEEIARLRLTDAEREAVEMAYSRLTAEAKYTAVAATLRGLLERHGPTGSE